MTEVRLATASDCEAIASIKVVGWASTYAGMVAFDALAPHLDPARQLQEIADVVANATNLVLVAEHNGVVVGFAVCMTATGEGAYLDSLHVLPEYRDRRVGRRLLGELARRLMALGHRALHLHVVEGNARARAFYERLGGRLCWRGPAAWAPEAVVEVGYRWDDLAALLRA